MIRRTLLVSVLALLLSVVGLPRAAAITDWETNFAVQDPDPARCSFDAYQGGTEWEPHYMACLEVHGDLMWAFDAWTDGHAAVMKWRFYPYDGTPYASAPSRQGLCIYTGGHHYNRTKGYCNKDLPERGYFKYWAGYRRVDSSVSPSDMTFGDPYCLNLTGSDGIFRDPNCIYA
jgi:hypothetical protein